MSKTGTGSGRGASGTGSGRGASGTGSGRGASGTGSGRGSPLGVVGTLTIGGEEYVVIPKAEYSSRSPAGGFAGASNRLRDARQKAGLTQAGLAKRLGRSQTFVSLVEAGRAQVNERYVGSVLNACKLPPNWGAPKRRRGKLSLELEANEIAGVDPETLALVRRGSKRDKELQRKYAWWATPKHLW
jgi:transcriptional regulator with XRE-family HTH domain